MNNNEIPYQEINKTLEPSQKSQQDISKKSAKFLDQVTNQIDIVIDSLYSTKEVPGQPQQPLDQKCRDKLKKDIKEQFADLRKDNNTALTREGWAVRHAILKRFYGPEQSQRLRDLWKHDSDWARVANDKDQFQRRFDTARRKHETLEGSCSLEIIAEIETDLEKVITPDNLLHENLKIIKSYLKAEGYHINKAFDKWEEISRTCYDPNQQTEIVEVFRKHLDIQSQEERSGPTRLTEQDSPESKLPPHKRPRYGRDNVSSSTSQSSEIFITNKQNTTPEKQLEEHNNATNTTESNPDLQEIDKGVYNSWMGPLYTKRKRLQKGGNLYQSDLRNINSAIESILKIRNSTKNIIEQYNDLKKILNEPNEDIVKTAVNHIMEAMVKKKT